MRLFKTAAFILILLTIYITTSKTLFAESPDATQSSVLNSSSPTFSPSSLPSPSLSESPSPSPSASQTPVPSSTIQPEAQIIRDDSPSSTESSIQKQESTFSAAVSNTEASVSVSQISANPGEMITVSWSGIKNIPADQERIGLILTDPNTNTPIDEHIQCYDWISNHNFPESGSCQYYLSYSLEPKNYRIDMITEGWNYTNRIIMAKSNQFAISDYAIKVSPLTVARGQNVTVSWNNIPNMNSHVWNEFTLSSQKWERFFPDCTLESSSKGYPPVFNYPSSGSCTFTIPYDATPGANMTGDKYFFELKRENYIPIKSQEFTILPTQNSATVKGRVFSDKYCTGVWEEGYKGVSGFKIDLLESGVNYQDGLAYTSYTDSDGFFIFNNVVPGKNYSLADMYESGTYRDHTSPNTSNFPVGPGETKTVDFGILSYDRYSQPDQRCSKKPIILMVHVEEYDSNGYRIGEINDATVKLTDTNHNQELQKALSTNSSSYTQSSSDPARPGFATLSGIKEGTYGVLVYKPGYEGKYFITNACGWINFPWDPQRERSQISPVNNQLTEGNIAASKNDITLNPNGACITFGLIKIGSTPIPSPTPSPSPTSSPSGQYDYSATYWIDYNHNGQRDCDDKNRCDKGLSGIEVTMTSEIKDPLTDKSTWVKNTATTDSNGFYGLSDLPRNAFVHVLSVKLPADYRCVYETVERNECQSIHFPFHLYFFDFTKHYNYDIPLYLFDAGQNKNLSAGQKVMLNGNFYILGDVKIDGKKMFDDNPKTGMFIYFKGSGEVEAPWGATVIDPLSGPVDYDKYLQQDIYLGGCGSYCGDKVQIKHWPEDGSLIESETELKPGEKKIFPANTIISGDVKINGIKFYDDSDNSGLVVKLSKETEVEAEWGATIYSKPAELINSFAETISGLMKQNGCVKGCDSVEIKTN